MVLDAMQNKSIGDIVFAVPARIVVAVLVMFAWSKLKEPVDGFKDGRKGIVEGVLIPLVRFQLACQADGWRQKMFVRIFMLIF